MSRGISAGSCCPSPSMNTKTSPEASRAPVLMAAPLPREYEWRTQNTPLAAHTASVSSVDPSSTTITSSIWPSAVMRGSKIRSDDASLRAGMITEMRLDDRVAAMKNLYFVRLIPISCRKPCGFYNDRLVLMDHHPISLSIRSKPPYTNGIEMLTFNTNDLYRLRSQCHANHNTFHQHPKESQQ